jgi:Short-chain alcohol dehydrogenase of unknown specificity
MMAEKGYTVFSCMRDPEGKNINAANELLELSKSVKGNIHVIDMDVTNDDEVINGVKKATEIAGGIDVVINNAGFAGIGWQEEFTVDQFHQVMDVFLYAAQRLYRAVLPQMRERKSGLFINNTTIGARMAVPLRQGPYSCAKWALEVLSERYQQELGDLFNIDSVALQPSPTSGTQLVQNAFMANDEKIRAGYPPFEDDRYYKVWKDIATQFVSEKKFDDLSNVSQTMIDLIEMPVGERPVRIAVPGRCIIGFEEVQEMNELFGKSQDAIEAKWIEGKSENFWAEQ